MILPIRLDDTQIPGLPETVGYVAYDESKIEKIVEMVIKKLAKLLE